MFSLYKNIILTLIFFVLILVISPIQKTFALGDGSVKSIIEINTFTNNGPSIDDDDNYGSGISRIGDLNQDGIEDIAVGAFNATNTGSYLGAVFIHFMNTDGSIISTVKIDDSTPNGPTFTGDDIYGRSVADIGDLNNDGIPDIAVGAAASDVGGINRGAVFIHFMNTNGSIKSTKAINSLTPNGPILGNDDRFGSDIVGLGDFDGDSVEDIAVGAIADDAGGSNKGCVHILFLNTDGSVKSTREVNALSANGPILEVNDSFGRSVATIGDLDLDGVKDLIVGASLSNLGATDRGAIFVIFLNSNGTIKSTKSISSLTPNGPDLIADEHYGSAVCDVGDLNEDGIPEIAVGAVGGAIGSGSKGEVFIHYMDRDGSVKGSKVINETTANGPLIAEDDRYGSALGNIGDLNRDGIPDLLSGANLADRGGVDRGVVFVQFMGDISFYSDKSSRLAVNTPSDHEIVIGTSYGLVNSGETLTLEFDEISHSFDLSALSISDIILTDINGNNRNLASTAGIDTWGILINTSNDSLIFTTPVSGSGYYQPGDPLIILIGENAGGTNQIINPLFTSLAIIKVTLDNANLGESGEILIPIVDSDQVNITAYVNAYIHFDIDSTVADLDCLYNSCKAYGDTGLAVGNYTIDLGELNSVYLNISNGSSVRHSDGGDGIINSIYFDISSNAPSGVVVFVKSENSGLNGPVGSSINSVSNDGDEININSGKYGFTLPIIGSGYGSLVRNSNCTSLTNFCRLVSTGNEVFNTNYLPIDSGRLRLDIAAAASYVNNPGIYTDTLTFTAVATY